MNYNYLMLFLDVAEQGSMNGASKLRNVAQSAVSRTVRELELRMKLPLLERFPWGVRLTEEGEVLVSLARLVRAEGIAAKRVIERAVKARSMVELLIGASLAAAGAVIPGAITRFLSNTDDCRAVVRTGQFEDLLESLVRGEIDIVVCHIGYPVPSDVSVHLLYQDDFVIVSGSSNRLACEAPLDTEALLDALWVLPPKESRRHADLSRAFASLEMPMPVARAETLSIELIRGLLLSGGDWLTLLPREMFARELEAGQLVVLREAQEFWLRPVGALTRRAVTKATAHIPRFIECLGEEVTSIQARGKPVT
jgi:DNA-binding transcriptional LysR family regulator